MGSYREIKGDLIQLAKQGEFDVVTHGCNCFNTMAAGIAVKFAETFGADRFKMEHRHYYGNINKLGTIDGEDMYCSKWDGTFQRYQLEARDDVKFHLTVINAYTQYEYGRDKVHLDYEALRICLRKINTQHGIFSEFIPPKKIGLPQIGCGLAGGNWDIVKSIIKEELKDMDVTVVIYEK